MKNILLIFGLFAVFSFPVHAFIDENNLDGFGLEIIMNGVGQARTGSHGAMNSNPALLAWLPQKQEFMSSNQISFYNLKGEEGELDVSPDIIPRFAASSEGFEKWGHSYGLTVNNVKIGFSQNSPDQMLSGVQEKQHISLNYSFGYLVSKDLSFGFGIHISRLEDNGIYSILGIKPGEKFSISLDQKKSVFVQGFSFGAAARSGAWAYGISSKFTTSTYMARVKKFQSGYYEVLSNTNVSITEYVPPVDIIPIIKAGVKREFKNLNMYLDTSWSPKTYSSDTEDYQDSEVSIGIAAEGRISEKYGWYSSYLHGREEKNNTDSGALSVGASKKNDHSLNFAGISFAKGYQRESSSIFQINFGTMFDY